MKKRISLKIRFIVFFAVFIVVLCAVISAVSINKLNTIATDIFAQQGLPIVNNAAGIIDPGAFEALARSLDPEDPFYPESCEALYRIKRETGCTYLYTMAPKDESTFYFIIDGSAPMDDEENFSPLGEEEDVSEYDDAFKATLRTETTQFSKPAWQGDWGWLISVYSPIKNSSGKMVGIIGCDFSAEDLRARIVANMVEQIILGLVFIILGTALMSLFLNMFFKPLREVRLMLEAISAGGGDLTKKIDIRRHDEIGELSGYFNATLETIRNLVTTIKQEAIALFDIGNQLSANSTQTASAISQIAAHIRNIQDRVINQAEGVTGTNAAMERITLNIEKLNDHIEEQSASVARSSSAIEEMLANIQSVTTTLIKNTENVRALTGASGEGQAGLQAISSDIREIARESEGLLEINGVIQNIAGMTNLLSMNAAIEAAHAGEAGKGFAVVAGEIRKLAEDSGKQSKIIQEVLKKIKGSIDKITLSTETALRKFEVITQEVQIVAEQEESIRNAMEEQSEGSKQVLEAVAKMKDITLMVKSGSQEMYEGSKEVIKESRNLEQVTQEIAGGMSEMSSGADEISRAVNEVRDISDDNRKTVNVLVGEVSKFKVV
jgi:methyl-accepting chemotaxis protein